jgi:hypothetical protein
LNVKSWVSTHETPVSLQYWLLTSPIAFYPYPRTQAANDTDWLPGFLNAFHPDVRASFNNTRYNRDGFAEVYKGFSAAIGAGYGTGWQQWREFYVSSPNTWDPKDKGGVVTGQGFNGGVLRGQTVAQNYPNAAYFVIEEIRGKRWIVEFREHGTSPGQALPKEGQKWPCDSAYEVCKK